MSRDRLEVTFECPECGGIVLELPDNCDDDSIATCKACGREAGPLGEIKKNAVKRGKADLSKKAHDPLRGFGKRR